jgi:hypothetical protein
MECIKMLTMVTYLVIYPVDKKNSILGVYSNGYRIEN